MGVTEPHCELLRADKCTVAAAGVGKIAREIRPPWWHLAVCPTSVMRLGCADRDRTRLFRQFRGFAGRWLFDHVRCPMPCRIFWDWIL